MMRRTIAFAAVMLVLPVFALSAQTRGGLTKVELLALQQEMRDQACGNKHAAGTWDDATKKAIRTCAKRYNTSTNAKELLAAMNIGFSSGDTPPMGGGMKGDKMSEMGHSKMMSHEAMEAKENPDAASAGMKGPAKQMKGDMKAKHDAMKGEMMTAEMKAKHDAMKGDMKMKHDSAIKQ